MYFMIAPLKGGEAGQKPGPLSQPTWVRLAQVAKKASSLRSLTVAARKRLLNRTHLPSRDREGA
jgi:hypothetical protein